MANFMNQRGVHEIKILAIVSGFFVISLFAVFIALAIKQYYVQETTRIQNQIKDISNQQLTLGDTVRQIEVLTGFYTGNRANFTDVRDVSTKISDLLAKLNARNVQIKDQVKQEEILTNNNNPSNLCYPFMPVLSTNTIEENTLSKVEYADNLEKVLIASFQRIIQLQQRQKTLEEYRNKLALKTTEQKKYRETILNDLGKALETLETEKTDLQTNFDNQLAQLKETKDKAEQMKQEAQQKIEEINNEKNEAQKKFNSDLTQKRNKIRELQAEKYGRTTLYSPISKQREFQSEEEPADGKIVFADPRSQMVYLDLGKNQGVIRGLKFDIYRQSTKAAKVLIGRIELTKVMDQVSQATIIEIKNRFDPIVNGDILINPLFNYKEPIHVAIAGDFRKMKNEDVKMLIEQLGAKVEPDVTVKTNFVIMAQKGEQHENFKQACTFGVPLMNEETLLRYIGD